MPLFPCWLLVLAFLFLESNAVVIAQVRDSTAMADSLLILELQQEMEAATKAVPPRQTIARTRPSTNPNISLIGDLRGWYISEGARNVDIEVHEVETSFQAVVDPFARGDIYLSVAP